MNEFSDSGTQIDGERREKRVIGRQEINVLVRENDVEAGGGLLPKEIRSCSQYPGRRDLIRRIGENDGIRYASLSWTKRANLFIEIDNEYWLFKVLGN